VRSDRAHAAWRRRACRNLLKQSVQHRGAKAQRDPLSSTPGGCSNENSCASAARVVVTHRSKRATAFAGVLESYAYALRTRPRAAITPMRRGVEGPAALGPGKASYTAARKHSANRYRVRRVSAVARSSCASAARVVVIERSVRLRSRSALESYAHAPRPPTAQRLHSCGASPKGLLTSPRQSVSTAKRSTARSRYNAGRRGCSGEHPLVRAAHSSRFTARAPVPVGARDRIRTPAHRAVRDRGASTFHTRPGRG
jgi:hypothetical protein